MMTCVMNDSSSHQPPTSMIVLLLWGRLGDDSDRAARRHRPWIDILSCRWISGNIVGHYIIGLGWISRHCIGHDVVGLIGRIRLWISDWMNDCCGRISRIGHDDILALNNDCCRVTRRIDCRRCGRVCRLISWHSSKLN